MQDLASRLSNRVQLTTDGHKVYLGAVEDAFQGYIDYAMLHKVYGAAPDGPETRYSPAECIGTQKHAISGCSDAKHVSTSPSATTSRSGWDSAATPASPTPHSKKLRNHVAPLGLFFCFYNFCRIHQSLRVTPCMVAGVTSRVWSVEDLLALLPPVAEGKKRDRTRSRRRPRRGGDFN